MDAACSVCGGLPDPSADGDPRVTWTSEIGDRGVVTWVCPLCTREHVRAIEAKLDPQWW